VNWHRIKDFGERLEDLPELTDRESWETLVAKIGSLPFRPLKRRFLNEAATTAADDLDTGDLARLTLQKASLPCNACVLFGACQKSDRHPFARLLQRYLDRLQQMRTVQDHLWRSFLHHFHLLQSEGYVGAEGQLTEDGRWASKLRLDQPLLISEGIRRQAFPDDQPALLAGLLAPFVMDRDRPGDAQTGSLAFKYPNLAAPHFRLLQTLRPLRERLEQAGFELPPLPFWSMVIVYHWALGEDWETLRKLTGMDDGDLAMVILRTADHLRQIESLAETHPRLAASARQAIGLILREPVLVE
jgi:ATP-dependent RNA helicase HelY